MEDFALKAAAFLLLLAIASFTIRLSQRLRLPHSVFLVLAGMLLALIAQFFPLLQFIGYFQLSPELLFYVLLPTLIFEAAFKLPLHRLVADIVPITLLSVVSYLISVAVIAVVLHGLFVLLGIGIPLLFTLLFAVIISATDPVAVLAIFQQLGVRPRLARLFEAESLFNDGTALAAFFIVLEVIRHGQKLTMALLPTALLEFTLMIGGGVLFGILMGFLFSKLIEQVRHQPVAEITLTLIMAHTTFLLADSAHLLLGIEISAIVATAVAAVILGNHGIQKFSPIVRQQMYAFWQYFAFAANAIIFLLIGMLVMRIAQIEVLLIAVIPLALAIVVTATARYLSVRSVLIGFNKFAKKHQIIPLAWQKILSWGSLRGAIAVAALLLLPDNLIFANWQLSVSPYDLLAVLLLGCILFTMFIKASSLGSMVHKLHLNELSSHERAAELEAQLLLDIELLHRLQDLQDKGYISNLSADKLKKSYSKAKLDANKRLAKLFNKTLSQAEVMRILQMHALTIEIKKLQKLLDYGEISEAIFWHLKDKLQRQEIRLENNQLQINTPIQLPNKIAKNKVEMRYQIARARVILTTKVIAHLQILQDHKTAIPASVFQPVMAQYQTWQAENSKLQTWLKQQYPTLIEKLELHLFQKSLKVYEQKVLGKLSDKSMVEERVFALLQSNSH